MHFVNAQCRDKISSSNPLSDSSVPSENWLGGVQGLRSRGGPGQQVECQTPEAVVWGREIQKGAKLSLGVPRSQQSDEL